MTKPFPTSLCHRCAAPPRYIESARGSVFILCPLLPSRYPPQPVTRCPLFRPQPPEAAPDPVGKPGDPDNSGNNT